MELEVDGKRVYAYTGAQPAGPGKPAVVFVHGAGNDHSCWVLQSRYFAHHGHSVLAVDLPGHGRSEGPPLPSLEAMGAWLATLVEAAGFDAAMLVGHSMGSLVVLEATAQRPERVCAAALLGPAVPMPVAKPLLDAARANRPECIDMLTVWGHGRLGNMGGNRAPGMWMMGASVRLLERAAPGVIYNDLNACNEYARGLESASRVRCPCLVITGDRDLMTPPRTAQDLVGSLAEVRTATLPGCGHLMMAERPDEVLDVLVDFLAGRRARGSA